tara:strand:+ start:1561 stop:1863 length:303 start_codon:yes stop_codon:yes gene_type:complete
MNNYTKTTLLLEEKVVKLLNKLKENHLNINQLLEKTKFLESNQELLKNKLAALEKQNKSLKIANNILGSNEGKAITKRKINNLINEVESCIFKLSEIKND